MRSLKYHPDRKGGSTAAFQRIHQAFQTLSDPDKRAPPRAHQPWDWLVSLARTGLRRLARRSPARAPHSGAGAAYDQGADVQTKRGDDSDDSEEDEEHKQSLREEVERKYYPERYDYWPFGDPFIHKRKREEQKRRQQGRRSWYDDDSD
jgi:curved DNA-binding protein CbpA